MGDPGLYAAIVNRNSGTDLRDCLTNLRGFLPPEKIVVVDCASRDGSVRTLPDGIARIIMLKENLGYTGGYNRALREIRDLGGKIALVITPDARISSHNAALLVELLTDKREIAAAYPLICKESDPKQLEAAFGKINYRHRLVAMIGEKGIKGKQLERFIDVDFSIGCCFAIRVDAFFEIGEFDESFFAYMEEVDLCRRLRDARYRTVVMPGVRAIHKGSKGNEQKALNKEYFVTRNAILYMKKHGGLFAWSKFALFFFIAVPVYYLPMAIFGRKAFVRRLQGYVDGIVNRPVRDVVKDRL